MNKILVLDNFLKLNKKDRQMFLDRLELKIDLVEKAYYETKSEIMKEQMNKMLYYFNLGYGFLKERLWS